MRARTGKIARLPAHIRHGLNRRLDNGALGTGLADWLNALPEVQRVLAERFASQPISDDNLSQWRHGGFQDWRREEERRVRLRELDSRYQQLDPVQRSGALTAAFEKRLALELTEELERISALKDRDERFQKLRRLSRDICRLQDARTRERNVRLLEAKAHASPATDPRQRRARSDLPEPSRTKHYMGGGGKP
jgi:hypothetical protein